MRVLKPLPAALSALSPSAPLITIPRLEEVDKIEWLADLPLAIKLKWGKAEIERYAAEQALRAADSDELLTDETLGIEPWGDSDVSAYARSCCKSFWRRQATRAIRILQELEELKAGKVGKHAPLQYASQSALNWKKQKDEDTKRFLEKGILYSREHKIFLNLKDVAVTDEARLAQYIAMTKAIQNLADEQNLLWGMLTITLPGEYHANPGNRNKNYNGVSPGDAHKVIAEGWKRIRAFLAKHGIKLSGVRVEEPMMDGTPHWHIAFIYKDEKQLKHIIRAILTQFPEGLRLRRSEVNRGKLSFNVEQYQSLSDYDAGNHHNNDKRRAQCQIDLGATCPPWEKDGVAASFASYVLKYIAKALGLNKMGTEDKVVNAVVAHRKTYGIRSIQFFGLPRGIVGAWQNLRKVDLGADILPSAAICGLAAIAQQDSGAGATELMRLMGGLSIAPTVISYSVGNLKEPRVNRYGEQTKKNVGIEIFESGTGTSSSYIFPDFGFELMTASAAMAIDELKETGLKEVRTDKSLVQLKITVTSDKRGLDERQKDAVFAPFDQDLYVVAGAGSGKTRVLMYRALYLADWVDKNGGNVEDIVPLAFTRAAAEEMQERLFECALELAKSTQSEMFSGFEQKLEEKRWLKLAERLLVATMHSTAGKWHGNASGGYDATINHSAAFGKQDKYILIDEAQDLTQAQWAWVDAHAKTVFAVGDFRQAIYGFRGADSSVFIDRVATKERVVLNMNYRSSAEIVDFANAIAQVDAAYSAKAAYEVGFGVSYRECFSEQEELNHLIDWVTDLKESGWPGILNKSVVLARTNDKVATLRMQLLVRGLDIEVRTIHSAKGLEWLNVAVFNGKRSENEESPEARELYYVACTRAKSNLYLSSTGTMPKILGDAIDEVNKNAALEVVAA